MKINMNMHKIDLLWTVKWAPLLCKYSFTQKLLLILISFSVRHSLWLCIDKTKALTQNEMLRNAKQTVSITFALNSRKNAYPNNVHLQWSLKLYISIGFRSDRYISSLELIITSSESDDMRRETKQKMVWNKNRKTKFSLSLCQQIFSWSW